MKPVNHSEVLPLSSDRNILPHIPTLLVGRPLQGPLMFEQLVIELGPPHDWIVNDIEIDGVSQLKLKNLSGALFSAGGVVARSAKSRLSFSGLAVIEQDSEVAITVTYVGSDSQGAPFCAVIVGDAPPQRPTVLPITTKKALPPKLPVAITAELDQLLAVDMLEIEDGVDWIVNDICIDGTSQFKQSGDIPGDLFSTSGGIDNFVKFDPGKRIELIVTYIGLDEGGSCFTARLLGTVVRDDLQQPPPDVHARIRTADEEEHVVARCNWRSPYVRPGA